jgi:hypothetical protein
MSSPEHEPLPRQELPPGTRVRFRAPSLELRLRSPYGTVVEWEGLDYYRVRLDQPAVYEPVAGRSEGIQEVIEDADNLAVVPFWQQPILHVLSTVSATVHSVTHGGTIIRR